MFAIGHLLALCNAFAKGWCRTSETDPGRQPEYTFEANRAHGTRQVSAVTDDPNHGCDTDACRVTGERGVNRPARTPSRSVG